MSHNFKPGDLALITNDNFSDNIGRVVELQFMVRDGEEYEAPVGARAQNTSGQAVWIVTAEGLTTRRDGESVVEGWTQKAQQKLMPIRGDFAPTEQKSKAVWI